MLLFINAAQQSWAKRNRYFSNMLLSTEIFSKRRKICAIWRETWGDFTYYLQNAIDRVKFCQIWAFTVPVMYIFFQTKKQDSFGHFLIVVAVSLLKFSMKKRIKWRKVCVLEISTINYSGNYNMQMRLFHKRNQYFILEIWHNLRELHFNQSSVSGVMVSIVAFQAVDRGSIPRWRTFLVNSYYKKQTKHKNLSEVGFEPTPTFVDQNALTINVGKELPLSLAP